MPRPAGETSRLVDLFRCGNKDAKDRLFAHAYERLRQLTSRMLRSYPNLLRRKESDDVHQSAQMRLSCALEKLTPESSSHFYNLAAVQIRRELIDQSRQLDGLKRSTNENEEVLDRQASPMEEPETLEAWTNFHEMVESLPDKERDVFGLIWYDDLTQDEAADLLGVSIRTVKRRWQSARLILAVKLKTSGDGL